MGRFSSTLAPSAAAIMSGIFSFFEIRYEFPLAGSRALSTSVWPIQYQILLLLLLPQRLLVVHRQQPTATLYRCRPAPQGALNIERSTQQLQHECKHTGQEARAAGAGSAPFAGTSSSNSAVARLMPCRRQQWQHCRGLAAQGEEGLCC